jgi:DNA-binding transcriptional ArsR family regulator
MSTPPTNPMGDLEITDPQMLRALAHPVRLAILDHLRREGPATATEMAPTVGATPTVTSWHLRHLQRFGLVRDAAPGTDRRQRRWETAVRGFRFETAAEDGEERAAAIALARQMFLAYAELPQRWITEVEPDLEPEWRGLGGLSNTRITVSAAELAAILQGVEEILAPYATRDAADRPADARGVRLLRYTLPEPSGEDDANDHENGPDQ